MYAFLKQIYVVIEEGYFFGGDRSSWFSSDICDPLVIGFDVVFSLLNFYHSVYQPT